MRPKLVLGWGLVGVVAAAPAAAAQFAADRPALPAAPRGDEPPGAPATAPAAHPWYVRAECGAWMICAKSYTGPQAKALAEELAKEIRETYGVPAYLFEKGSEEKKRQEEFVAREAARQRAEQEKFRQFEDKMREEAVLKGMDFIGSAPKVKVPRYSNLEEQWAVLIGGWKDMDTARKELDKIRAWQPPRNDNLMDREVIIRPGKEQTGEIRQVNPFLHAMVFPNPVAPKGGSDDVGLKALHRLNEKEELSLLRATKAWTIVVKSFHPPVKVRDKDGEKSVVERLFARDEGAKELQAAALQAAAMAKALRDPKFKPRSFDAYVLHTLYGSWVCVGQFDGPDDAGILETQRLLEGQKFTMERHDQVGAKAVRLFDPMFAMQIPRGK